MKLALIPPISLLGYTELTKYQLALPHLFNDSRYRAWYKYLADQPEQYVILDNGEAEGENHYGAIELLNICDAFGFDEIVAPDTMGSAESTVRRTKDFLKAIKDEYVPGSPKIGAVIQGSNWKEVRTTMNTFAEMKDIDVVYFPRHLLVTLGDKVARIKLADEYREKFGEHQEIHFLGANPVWSKELESVAKMVPFIRGYDTSMPFNYAYDENHVASNVPAGRPPRYFDMKVSQVAGGLVDDNVLTMLGWANGS